MINFLRLFLKAPKELFLKLTTMPITAIFYAVISRWFFIMIPLCLIVMYWVMKGLIAAGVISAGFKAFEDASMEIKAVAQFCTPKIGNVRDFLDCLNNTPKYTGDQVTNLFEIEVKKEEEKLKKMQGEYKKNNISLDLKDFLTPYDFDDDDPQVHGAKEKQD